MLLGLSVQIGGGVCQRGGAYAGMHGADYVNTDWLAVRAGSGRSKSLVHFTSARRVQDVSHRVLKGNQRHSVNPQ